MRILTYCDVSVGDMAQRLGTPEYSYYFVLEAFHDALTQFADVQRIENPEIEADAIWENCRAVSEDCLLLSFTPPHKMPLGLRCPTIVVFAWEYPDLPQGWEEACWKSDPRHDWRMVLNQAGKAITLSMHTVKAVKHALGQTYPIVSIPTPVWEKFDAQRRRGLLNPQRRSVDIHMTVAMVDSHRLGLSAEGLADAVGDDGTPSTPKTDAELPMLAASETDRWRPITTAMQDEDEPYPGNRHPIPPQASNVWEIPPRADIRTRLSGVVYTAVLTPADGRKNWEDLITAFGWAFRDIADATLVLKLGGPNLLREHHQMLMLLTKLSPMQCRIVALHGYLNDDDYAQLIGATTYYVNASLCEGLCMPLLEFLCCGVPALAPDHTSMADYIDPNFTFVIDSVAGQPALWPHGDHEIYRTTRYRINWNSLMQAYRQSYLVAKNQTGTYAEMSANALRQMQNYCSIGNVAQSLRDFLQPLAAVSRAPSAADLIC